MGGPLQGVVQLPVRWIVAWLLAKKAPYPLLTVGAV